MSDYDSMMSDADADRIYNKELDVHNRDCHDPSRPPAEGCLICEEMVDAAVDEDEWPS